MNKLYQTEQTTQTKKAKKASFVRYIMLLAAVMMLTAGKAVGQDLYIIHNGNNYLSHNASTGAVNTTRTTTFNPTTCFWIISDSYLRPVNSNGEVLGNLYLRPRSGRYTYSLNTNTSTDYATWSGGLSDGGQPSNTYYLRLNSTTWEVANTNSNRGTLRLVTKTSYPQGVSEFTISGPTSINATGTYTTYTHTNASYSSIECTNYYFNSSNHYLNSSNEAVSPTITTISSSSAYAWSLSDNAVGYATVNASTGAVTVSAMPDQKMTITLYCTCTYNEQTVTATFPITLTITGVSGDIVTLDDREDHSWSYYSDATCPIRSLSPADVKITYYGDGIVMTGNADYTASSVEGTNYIKPGNANYVGGAKVNVGGENENTFVYYKTLERGANTQTAYTFSSSSQSAAESRCPYTTIPNPFQVRPTYGSLGSTEPNDFTGWRGFQCWRLKSVTGGSVYSGASGGSALTTGAIINGETEIYFAPNGEYSMEVELEAVWARAYLIRTSNSNKTPAIPSYNVGVERNFVILATGDNYRFNGASGNRITNTGYAATISRYYPNSNVGNTGATVSGNNTNITLGANTKFENVTINVSGNYISAAGHNLIIGRGCSNSTAGYIYGNGSNGMDYSLRIESGTYTNFYALYRYTNNNYGTYSGTNKIRSTLGSDYDRAKTDNDKLTITGEMWMGEACRFSSESNGSDGYFKCWVKSGNLINGTISDGNGGGESFYLGTSGSQNASKYIMPRYLYMEGGIIAGVAGGLDDQYYTDASDFRILVRQTGGYIRGCLYGAGSYARGAGERKYILTGGEIGGWVAAGCNGIGGNTTEANNGAMDGDSYIYIGGNVVIGYKSITVNDVEGGNVFGAGRGAGGKNYDVGTVNNSNLVVADDCRIEKNVYGGGNYGYSLGEANIYVLGGTVDGKVFGGANMTKGFTPTILMKSGLVKDGIYGGCNTEGSINNKATITINGGQVGTSESNASVYGGGLGTATRMKGDVEVNVGSRSDCAVSGTAVIYGDVYGGSAKGITNCNDAGTARNGSTVTNVTLNKGTIYGSLYGGGHGIDNAVANVWGPVTVKVYGGTLTGGVYGANNLNGAPQNSVTVDIYGTDPQPAEGYAIANVYGGGNQAAYNNANYPTVTVHNCNNSIGNVYGGGNAAAVTNTNVTIYGGNRIGAVYAGGNGTGVAANFVMCTTAVANIYGGTIGRVFAGNNSSGTISNTKTVNIDAGTDETTNASNCITCGDSPMKIGAVFHGGNQAAGTQGTVNIVCTGTTTAEYIDTLFGGANNANITGDVTLNIDRGHIRTGIFGGNNSGGKVTGDITINLTKNSGNTCAFNYPTVFGGGYGAATETGGNITINIGEKTSTATAPTIDSTIAGGAIYGGSALGSVNDASNETTTINIYNGTITGNIYGGGLGEAGNANKGKVNGAVAVNISTSDQTEANCAIDLRNSSIYGCNNTGGSPQGDVRIDVWKTGFLTDPYSSGEEGTLYAIDQVFGGGNAADYNPAGDNKATVYIHNCVNSIRRVFGGGNAAAAKGVVTTIDGGRFDWVFGGGNGEDIAANIGSGGTNLTVNAGRINHLFGGSNERGSIAGQMRTNVNYSKMGTSGCDELIIEFFGGGNLAPIGSEGSPVNLSTTIECNTIFSAVYGGSNLADIYGDVTLTINGGTIGEAYGGSKGVASGDATYPAGKAANIHGNVKLNIYGGAIGRAYGGSNINGNITETIGVDLDWSQSSCPGKSIDYIYGASNQAAYTPTDATDITPTVKLINGTVNYNVYGGGRGTTATVTANPKVIAGDGTTSTNNANVNGDVFGGGDAANVVGSTNVIVQHNSKIGKNVFGGGNAADIQKNSGVGGNTQVWLKDRSRVYGNVYGGGNQGPVAGDTKVIVNSQ